jgi:hypothetical protein
LQGWFIDLQQALATKVFDNPVPLMGSQLSSPTERQIFTSLRQGLDNALAPEPDNASPAAVRQALFNALGPGGAGLLSAPSDIAVGTSGDGQTTTFQMVLHQQGGTGGLLTGSVPFGVLGSGAAHSVPLGAAPNPVNLDLALPGLPLHLQAQGNVDVSLGYDYALKFGITRQGNSVVPFLDPSFTLAGGSSPLAIHVSADIAGSQVSGQLGFLQVSIADDPSHPSSFTGTYYVDPSVTALGKIPNLTADLTGSADVNLKLAASFSASASATINPRLSADFHLGWTFNGANTGAAIFGNTPTIQFNHVTLDLSSFLRSLQPILRDVQNVTGQLQPVVDFLNSQVPVLSSLTGQNFTFGKLIDDVAGTGNEVETLANFVNTINHLSVTLGNGVIDLGSFTVSDARPNAGPGKIATEQPAHVSPGGLLGPLESAGFDFPILDDPRKAFGLFFNQPTDIVTLQVPHVNVSASFGQSYYVGAVGPVPIFVHFGGNVGFQAGATIGYDTTGLRTGNLLDGFFVKNGLTDAGGNPAVVLVSAELDAGLGVGIDGVLSGKVSGYVQADGELSLQTGADGKYRPSQDGWKVFHVSGTLTAGLRVEIDTFFHNFVLEDIPVVTVPLF